MIKFIPTRGKSRAVEARNRLVNSLLEIMGDARLLYLPTPGDTTTSTEKTRHAATITWDASIAARIERLGLGFYQTFDGSSDEGDTPDNDRMSFNGANDLAFSVIALLKLDVNNVAMAVVSKGSSSSLREWDLGFNSSGHPQFLVIDDSASAYLGRRDATAIGTSWALLAGTYNGSGAVGGLNVYLNGVLVDDTDDVSGTYVGMENTAGLAHIGAKYTTKEGFVDGAIALIAVCAKELTIDDVWAIKALVNAHFDLSL